MPKLNCWEIKKCCREPGGAETSSLGVCPAAQDADSNGLNSGKNAGRICWAVAGTFCGGKVQCDFAMKQVSCMACEVFIQIKTDEGGDFALLKSAQPYKAATR
jgi:hypothetical protein